MNDCSYRAELFDDGNPRVRELESSAYVRTLDLGASCRREMQELRPRLRPSAFDEEFRWAFYPWRSTLVRIPGPIAYRRLRLDRNRNKITPAEQQRLSSVVVGIAGLSVGSATALTIAREGLCGRLLLADFDDIELTNLNRIWCGLPDVGCNKAVATARAIAELDPYLHVEVLADGIHDGNISDFVSRCDVVVDECDSLDVKLELRLEARDRGRPVLMETSDRGLLDVERFDLEPDRPLFHGLVPSLRADELAGLDTEDKVPYVLRILEPAHLSARALASLLEIGSKVSTWPQLASDVALGASVVATAIRRLFTAPERLRSGRLRIDLETTLEKISQPVLDDRSVEEAPRRREELPKGLFEAMLGAAKLAPSGGNVQPWRLQPTDTGLDLHIDRSRSAGMDIGHRGSLVAIGAALLNARLVAQVHGRDVDSRIFPEGTAADLVARLVVGQHSARVPPELARQVTRRVSNRRHGDARPALPAHVDALRNEAEAEGGGLLWLEGEKLEAVATIWAAADRLRFLTPRLHTEMMSELRRPGIDDLTTGIDLRTLELTSTDEIKLDVLRRGDVMAALASWDGGEKLGDDTKKRLRSASGLAIVTFPSQEPGSYVRGGMAMERVWLRATALDLAVQPMSPAFLYGHTEAELEEVAGYERGRALFGLRERFLSMTGLDTSTAAILALRVFCAPPPSAISLREG